MAHICFKFASHYSSETLVNRKMYYLKSLFVLGKNCNGNAAVVTSESGDGEGREDLIVGLID